MRALRITFMLFVVSVLVSQSAMDFFSTVLCFHWCYFVWKSRKTDQPKRLFEPMGLEKLWAAWIIVVAVGFALNFNEPAYALERILEFRWILIFYVMFQVMLEIKPERSTLKFVIPFAATIAAVNLFLYYAEIDFLTPWRYGYGEFLRAGGFFANPMTFAHSFVIFLSFLIGVTLVDFKQWNQQQKTSMVLILIFSLMGLYLTFTRGVWFGFIGGLSIGLFLWKPKYIVAMALAAILGFWSFYSVSPSFRSRIDRTTAEMNGESERKILWKAHGQIFRENPVFGAGYGQNTKQLARVYSEINAPAGTLISHAHNQYIHLAAGTGILGLLCYLGIWGFFLKKSWDLWRWLATDSWDKGIALGLIIGQLAFMIGSLTEANFEHSKVRFMVMLAWAYVIYLTLKYNKNRASIKTSK